MCLEDGDGWSRFGKLLLNENENVADLKFGCLGKKVLSSGEKRG